MGKFVRNLGAFSGGAATGYLGGRQDARQQTETDIVKRQADSAYAANQEAGTEVDKWLAQREAARAQLGNRNPAAVGAAAGAAAANPLAATPTPMLTQAAPNAVGPEAMQSAPMIPFVTQRQKAPRTLPFLYDNLDGG